VTQGTGAIFKFEDVGPRPGELKGCAIRRSRGIAVLNVSSLAAMAPRPCVQQRKLEDSSAARRARRSFPKEKVPDFSREFLEKNPANMEKNSVSLFSNNSL
jgi:hypothetical protein